MDITTAPAGTVWQVPEGEDPGLNGCIATDLGDATPWGYNTWPLGEVVIIGYLGMLDYGDEPVPLMMVQQLDGSYWCERPLNRLKGIRRPDPGKVAPRRFPVYRQPANAWIELIRNGQACSPHPAPTPAEVAAGDRNITRTFWRRKSS